MDFHYGNGSDDIIQRLNLDVPHLGTGHFGREDWDGLKELPEIIKNEFADCSVILYQAGADSWISDPLGGTWTTEQMQFRDHAVFQACKDLKIPVCWNLSGGYSSPIRKVLDLHDQTAMEFLSVFGDL